MDYLIEKIASQRQAELRAAAARRASIARRLTRTGQMPSGTEIAGRRS
jgi:hypothetical protein